MIKTLEELIDYNKKIGDELGGIAYAPDVYLDPLEISQDQIKILRNKLVMPESYIQVIKKINLHEKVIGFFSISPAGWGSTNIVENLLEGNEEGSMFIAECKAEHLVLVSAMSEQGFAVATKFATNYNEGEVVTIEEGRGIIGAIAKDFEQFLLIIVNMHLKLQELKKDKSKLEEKRTEFMEILSKLNVDQKYQEFWREFF